MEKILKEKEVVFQLKEYLGTLGTDKKGFNLELNIISWNGGLPKYDIRSWNADRSKMTRGITLSHDEFYNIIEAGKSSIEKDILESFSPSGQKPVEIIKNLTVAKHYPTGWTKDLSITSWNCGPAKYDIRDWDFDHEHCSRGITFTQDEFLNLVNLGEKELEKNNLYAKKELETTKKDIFYTLENIETICAGIQEAEKLNRETLDLLEDSFAELKRLHSCYNNYKTVNNSNEEKKMNKDTVKGFGSWEDFEDGSGRLVDSEGRELVGYDRAPFSFSGGIEFNCLDRGWDVFYGSMDDFKLQMKTLLKADIEIKPEEVMGGGNIENTEPEIDEPEM